MSAHTSDSTAHGSCSSRRAVERCWAGAVAAREGVESAGRHLLLSAAGCVCARVSVPVSCALLVCLCSIPRGAAAAAGAAAVAAAATAVVELQLTPGTHCWTHCWTHWHWEAGKLRGESKDDKSTRRRRTAPERYGPGLAQPMPGRPRARANQHASLAGQRAGCTARTGLAGLGGLGGRRRGLPVAQWPSPLFSCLALAGRDATLPRPRALNLSTKLAVAMRAAAAAAAARRGTCTCVRSTYNTEYYSTVRGGWMYSALRTEYSTPLSWCIMHWTAYWTECLHIIHTCRGLLQLAAPPAGDRGLPTGVAAAPQSRRGKHRQETAHRPRSTPCTNTYSERASERACTEYKYMQYGGRHHLCCAGRDCTGLDWCAGTALIHSAGRRVLPISSQFQFQFLAPAQGKPSQGRSGTPLPGPVACRPPPKLAHPIPLANNSPPPFSPVPVQSPTWSSPPPSLPPSSAGTPPPGFSSLLFFLPH